MPSHISARSSASSRFHPEVSTIRHIRDEVKARADRFVVVLVLNVKPDGAGPIQDDYEGFSVTSEYMSDEEVHELTGGFESVGCIVDLCYGEKEFNERLVRGDFARYGDLNKVVYHSTGSGTGRSRTALVPALCRLYGLRDCSNDVYTSTILENKVHFFNLLSAYGLPTPKTWFYDWRCGWLGGEPPRETKLIAKPAYECASIGVSDASVSFFTTSFFQHVRHLSEAMSQPVLVQEFVEGYEVEVPVFDLGKPFAPMSMGIDMSGDAFAGDHFLTYDQVYADRYDFFPFCRHMPDVGATLRRAACESFRILGLRGMVRVDFRVRADGRGYIIDYNNAPHLTEFHSCARSVKELGFDYSDMFCLLLYEQVCAA
jgi:D-alanine-D-alanine ligase